MNMDVKKKDMHTNVGNAAFDSTFTPLLHGIVERLLACPDRCAIRFDAADITNHTLLRRMAAIAAKLDEAGVSPGTCVGVCLARGPDWPALLLALWSRGAVYVPLDPALPRERLFTMCETAALDLVVTQPALRMHVDSLPCSLLELDTTVLAAAYKPSTALPALAMEAVAANDPAYILFTSGSSGMPKGVRISHRNIAALFAAVLPLLDLPEECRILGCANPGFDIAFFELLAPLLCGGTLVLADQHTCKSPLQLMQLIASEKVTVVQATPSHWQLLNAFAWNTPVSVAIATGEALLRDTAADILRHAESLWNLYGPTECTVWSSAQRVSADDLADTAPAIVSIGRALPGYTLQLEPGERPDLPGAGELVIAGSGVGLGYCDEPVSGDGYQRAVNSQQRAYCSGDLCRYDANGLLHYLGRRDNQAKHNGYRVELDEIARLLRQHMSILAAACLVRPARADRPSLLFACVVFRHGMPNRDKTALNAYLATWLPAWMLPQRYFFVERLPLDGNGKLDRAVLLSLTEPSNRQSHDDCLETRVARVFCEVLDVAAIGSCDSFLDAGGSSMLAATLVLTLNERLGSNLTLRQVLAVPPTVSSIVQLLLASVPNETS